MSDHQLFTLHPSPLTRAKRAVLMVWDGMRPDLVSPELTPNLARLAAEGVCFADSHAVFPTVTRVNSASLSTGALPGAHGIVGNTLYAPLVDPRAPISIGDHRSLYALVESRGGRLLPRDTVADRVHAAGGRTVVVSSGTPGSAFLCHPRVRECAGDRIFNPALMLPAAAEQEAASRLGPVPPGAVPNTEQNRYFNRLLTDYVLPDLDPTLLVYWHNDPDKTEHHRGFGSPDALLAIRDADDNLGRVLAALEARGLRDETAIAIASDHGYCTIDPVVEPTDCLREAGLAEALAAGRLILSRNGFALFVNVPDGDHALVEHVVRAFQAWQPAGCLFTGARGQPVVEGTLPLELVGLTGDPAAGPEQALAPDVLCAMAWDDGANPHGHDGRSAGWDAQYTASHGGISPWEIRNTLILAGPGLKRGLESGAPAGNIDLAPTLLHLLGLDPPPGQHGRVLAEALLGGAEPASLPVERETVVAERGPYRQRVQFSTVGRTRYLDWGTADRA
jgi:arylsulfatase A-like enzyme